jgi:hypothetical protein
MKSSSIVIPKKIFFGVLVILLVFIGSGLFAFIKRPAVTVFMPSTEVADSVYSIRVHAPVFPKEANFCGEDVPLQLPDIRERFDKELIINTYLQGSSLLNMKQTMRWFPVIEPILKKNGVPDDFKYLCIAESALQQAVSRAGASGFWQFMTETGKQYNLEINDEVDERYNVEAATEAACVYLKKSKDALGSWTLAAAAYNCGTNGCQGFMEKQQQKNYYDLLLPEETMRYVFRILAIKEIYSHPKRYGFDLEASDFYPPYQYKTITVNNSIEDLAQFAIDNGINYKLLKLMNPWLRKPFLKNLKHKTYDIKIAII